MHRNWRASACLCALITYKTEAKASDIPDAFDALSDGLAIQGEVSTARKGMKDVLGKTGGVIGEMSDLKKAGREGTEALAVANVKLGTKLILTGLTGGAGGLVAGAAIDVGVDAVVDHIYEGIEIQRQVRQFNAEYDANMAQIDARRDQWLASWEQQLASLPHRFDYQLGSVKVVNGATFSAIDPDSYHEKDRERARQTLSADPVCGTMEWYDTVGGTCRPQEQAEDPKPSTSAGWRPAQGGQCGFPDMDFEGIGEVMGKQLPNCQLTNKTKSDTQVRYDLNCAGTMMSLVAQMVSDDQIDIMWDYEGNGAFRQTTLIRCQ